MTTAKAALMGDPVVQGFTPNKATLASIIDANTAVSNELKAAFSAGKIPFDTKAAMDADLAYAAGVRAEVDGDTAANNGVYRKSGAAGVGTWVKVAPSTQELIDAAVSAESLFTASLDSEYVMRIDDAAGNLIGGIKWDASTTETNIDLVAFTSNDASADLLYYNNDDVFDDELTPTQATRNAVIGDRYDPLPSQGGDVVAVRHAAGSARPATREEFATEGDLWPFDSAVSKIAILATIGQSLGAGLNGGDGTNSVAVTTSSVAPGKVAMFGNGIRHLGTTHSSQWADYPFRVKSSDGTPGLIDCFETRNSASGETGLAVAAKRWQESLGADTGVVVATCAIGSAQKEGIAKGTTPYLNMLRIAAEVRRLAELHNCAVDRVNVIFDDGQSESTNNLSAADWAAFILQLQADLEADLKAVTGVTNDVLMHVHQASVHPENSGGFGRTLVETPQGVVLASYANDSKIKMLPPSYMYELNDGIHPTSAAYRDRGDFVGVALSMNWNAFWMHCDNVVRTGTRVTFQPNGTNIVADTTAFPDDGQLGCHFYDSAGNEIAATVTTNGVDVIMDLASLPPDSNNKIVIALQGALYTGGNKTTAGSPLRSGSSYGTNSAGDPMYPFMQPQIIDCP